MLEQENLNRYMTMSYDAANRLQQELRRQFLRTKTMKCHGIVSIMETKRNSDINMKLFSWNAKPPV